MPGIRLALVGFALVATACSSSDGGGTPGGTRTPCIGSFQCAGARDFCVGGFCVPEAEARVCRGSGDCADPAQDYCVDGRCLRYECGPGVRGTGCLRAQDTCTDNKCIPSCRETTDCQASPNFGFAYLCRSFQCAPIDPDADLDTDRGEPEPDPDEREADEEETAAAASCVGKPRSNCGAYAASCLYDALACANFYQAGLPRDWARCETSYIEAGGQRRLRGTTMCFADGAWYRNNIDGTFEVGNTTRGVCYSGRFDSTLARMVFSKPDGSALGTGAIENTYYELTCGVPGPTTPVECYDTAAVRQGCDGFMPQLFYTPPDGRQPQGCENAEPGVTCGAPDRP